MISRVNLSGKFIFIVCVHRFFPRLLRGVPEFSSAQNDYDLSISAPTILHSIQQGNKILVPVAVLLPIAVPSLSRLYKKKVNLSLPFPMVTMLVSILD